MARKLLALAGVAVALMAIVAARRHREMAREAELWAAATDPAD